MHKLLMAAALLITIAAQANNVQLSNISVSNNITNTGKVIEFDLTWENSWRTASTNNWDGVWVFFKFKDNDGRWYPLRFNGNNITMPSEFAHDMGNNLGVTGIGMFIYRSANGSGTATAIDIRAGIQSFPGTFEVRGFAIEMVYVPQGSFYVGDGNNGTLDFQYRDSTTGLPYHVTGTGSTIQIGSAAGRLYDKKLTQPFTGNLGNFPSGYNAFWMMKYEVSQGAFRDFLNTLTYDQQAQRMSVPPSTAGGLAFDGLHQGQFRLRLQIKTPGIIAAETPAVVGCNANNNATYDEPVDGECNAMGQISWMDAAAYLDWAGLRPMTELEFEKACRGPLNANVNEYAWGNDNIITINTNNVSFLNINTATETISPASAVVGNAFYNINPNTFNFFLFRNGIFANSTSTRVSSGAGYYGAMELSGNQSEFTVATFNAAGRSFSGKHGDGVLDQYGNANENTWPGINGNSNDDVANTAYNNTTGVTSAAGLTTRGGANTTIVEALQISRRAAAATSTYTARSLTHGVRGVRDAN